MTRKPAARKELAKLVREAETIQRRFKRETAARKSAPCSHGITATELFRCEKCAEARGAVRALRREARRYGKLGVVPFQGQTIADWLLTRARAIERKGRKS